MANRCFAPQRDLAAAASLSVTVFVRMGRRVQAHLSLCVPAELGADRGNVAIMPK